MTSPSNHPADHQPYTDDGVTYCGWATGATVVKGCGELWPCSTIRAATDTTPTDPERGTYGRGVMPDRWTAPWTGAQVAALNAYQTSGQMHPYTCPHGGGHPLLRAFPDGWRGGAGCDYRQDWAHAIGAPSTEAVGEVRPDVIGFVWHAPDGDRVLGPEEVDIVLREPLGDSGWLAPAAAERLFEQRDTAISQAAELRTALDQTIAERDKARKTVNRLAPDAGSLQLERDTAIAEAAKLRAELERWTSGQRRKGLPVVEAVPDGLQVAASLARSIGTEGGEDHDALLSRAAQALKNLHDAASYLIAERDSAIADLKAFSGEVTRLYEVEREAERAQPVIEAAQTWRDGVAGLILGSHELQLAAAVDAYNTTKEASDDSAV